MHPQVRALRAVVKHIDGVWVRRWKDGSIWVGCQFRCDHEELRRLIEGLGYRPVMDPHNRFLEILP